MFGRPVLACPERIIHLWQIYEKICDSNPFKCYKIKKNMCMRGF